MGSKQTIIKIRAGNRAAAQLARQATRAEFKYTNRIDQAIYGNLAGNISGNTAALTAEQSRLTGALTRLKANQARGSSRISKAARTDVQSAYGSAVAGGNRLNLEAVQTVGKAGQKAVGAQAAAGGILARGNEAAASTLASGVQMAKQGARAQVADALAYRARNDAELAATRDNQLSMMVLQNKLDIENYKKKLELQDKASGSNGQMSAVATAAAGATQNLFSNFNQVSDGQGNYYDIGKTTKDDNGNLVYTDPDGNVIPVHILTAAESAGKYMNENAIDPAGPEGQVVLALSRAMSSAGAGQQPGAYSASPGDLVAAVNQQLSIMYPNFSKSKDTIDALIRSSLKVQMGQSALSSDGGGASTGGIIGELTGQGKSPLEQGLDLVNAPLHTLWTYNVHALNWLLGK